MKTQTKQNLYDLIVRLEEEVSSARNYKDVMEFNRDLGREIEDALAFLDDSIDEEEFIQRGV